MATIDLGMVTAYAYAVAGGYTGTEQEFEELLGNIATDLEEIENLSVTVTTLPAGSQATASYNNGVLALGIPKGDKGDTGATGATGPTGPTGNGIQSITKTGTAGNVDTYTITYTNGQTTTFTVTNGSVTSVDGKTGDVTLDDKANIDGYYEDLTAGYAENLISNVFEEDSVPYNFRTAGGSLDIGSFENDEVVGGTVAFNQMVQTSSSSVTVTSGHKYYSSINGTRTVALSNGSAISINDGTKDNVIDLTQAFGTTIADYIYTLETGQAGAGVAWFKKLFPKSYYPYNTGELMHVQTSGHKMVGFNQMNPSQSAVKGGYNVAVGTAINMDSASATTSGFNPITITCGSAWTSACYLSEELVAGQTYQITGTFSGSNIRASIYLIDGENKVLANKGNWSAASSFGPTVTPTENGTRVAISVGSNTASQVLTITDLCVHLVWDGERNGEYEAYSEHTYPLDSSLTLRGIPKLDSGNNLYYDGDTYEADGTVTRYYGIRAYQAGDENDSTVITDKTNTVYKLNSPTTETADAFQNPQAVSNWGTEEYIDERTIAIPVGHNTKYPPDLKAKLETSPNPPDADGDYIVRQTNGVNEYVALSSNATIQDILNRLAALEA